VEVGIGYLYAFLFFAQAIVHSCFNNQVFHISMTIGMKIKAAIIAMVFRKVRKLQFLFDIQYAF